MRIWTQHDREHHSCRLLSDSPDAPPHLKCLFEQEKVRKALRAAIMRARYRGNKGSTVLALFGKYGQGKSRLLEQLQRDFPFSRRFSVALYEDADLLHNFDIFMAPLLRRAILGILALLIIFLANKGLDWLVFTLFGAHADSAQGLFVKTLLFGLGAYIGWKFIVRDMARGLLLKGSRESLRNVWQGLKRRFRQGGAAPHKTGAVEGRAETDASRLLGFFGRVQAFFSPLAAPSRLTDRNQRQSILAGLRALFRSSSLIIIDDLDRASVEQQKAFLLALHKHKHDAGKVFLVAFDDEPLLTALADGQYPAELLDKTFDGAFRLAPLNAEDAALMACAFLETLWWLNPHCPWARRLNDPQIVGDLARMLFLHGSASARFARRVVNNLYLETLRLHPRDYNDISGLVRLAGIFQHVPALESHLDFLGRHLDDHDDERLIEEVQRRFTSLRGETWKSELCRFLERTRHMRTTLGGWSYLLRIEGRDLAQRQGRPLQDRWQKLERYICDRASRLEWALKDLASLGDVGPRGPVSLLRQLNEALPASESGFPDDALPVPSREETEQLMALLRARLQVHDARKMASCSPAQAGDHIAEYQSATHAAQRPMPPILLFLPGNQRESRQQRNWATPSQAMLHLRALMDTDISAQPTGEVVELLLRYANLDAPVVEFPPVGLNMHMTSAGVLHPSIIEYWPKFTDAPAGKAMRHFRALGELLPQLGDEHPCLPKEHEKWIIRQAHDGTRRGLLRILVAMLHLLPDALDAHNGQRIWCAQTVGKVFDTLDDAQKRTLARILSNHAVRGTRPLHGQRMWLSCLLASRAPHLALPVYVNTALFPNPCVPHDLDMGWIPAVAQTVAGHMALRIWHAGAVALCPDNPNVIRAGFLIN